MRKYCSRVIIENFFEPCVLYLLLQEPSYGYELKNNLDKRCGCKVNIGNLYKCLARLQKGKYVVRKKTASKIGPEKMVYEISASGRKLLREWIRELEAGAETINKLIINYKKYAKTDATNL